MGVLLHLNNLVVLTIHVLINVGYDEIYCQYLG